MCDALCMSMTHETSPLTSLEFWDAISTHN